MKRFIFIFLLVAVSLVFILSTFSWYKDASSEAQKKELNNFLSLKDELYNYDSSTSSGSFTTKKIDNSEYYYQSINPIDGIYYKKSENANPIQIKNEPSWIKILVSTGQYVFALNDVFQKYEVIWANFKISQLGKWIFFINNLKDDYKIYSFNSILDVNLIDNTTVDNKEKSVTTTNFKLFPSLLFKYNPTFNSILKWADILRVSMVDSIYYIDFKELNTPALLTWIKQGEANLVYIATEDINKKLKKYKELYKFVLKIQFNDISWFGLITNYQTLFDNNNKKEIYLKWILIKNFLDLVNGSKTQSENYANISSALDELAIISEDKKNEWIDLLKSYYYLSFYGKILIEDNSDLKTDNNSNANKVIRQILKDTSAGEDYFTLLSDIFFSYQFSNVSTDKLDWYLNNYLEDLKKRKILKDTDFLPFSFFLTQYSLTNPRISQNGISVIVYLIEMFDNYYMTIKDDTKWFNALWVQFYNFSKIITNINNWVIKKYFQKSQEGIVLKPEYIKSNESYSEATNLWEGTLDYLSLLYRAWYNDLQNKKPIFSKNLNSLYDMDILATNYWELAKKYNSLLVIINTLTDYNKYFEGLKLNQKNKEAQALIYNDTISLSAQDLFSYLSKFNWVDLNSILLMNQRTINTDRYYKVQVTFWWSILSFKLNPEWHTLSEMVIKDSNWEVNNLFKTQAINLDEKQKIFQDRYSSELDPIKKDKYNFNNFFINIFLTSTQDSQDENTSTVDTTNTTTDINESRLISIFKQDKLVDGDFTYINKFLTIPFKNIVASVDSWEYKIKLVNIRKAFNVDSINYIVDIDCDYNFVDKYFYYIKVRVYNTDLGYYQYDSNYIEIIPSSIRLQDFSTSLGNLWTYLKTLKSVYPQWQWNIKFDLNNKKVYIDSRSYDLIN